MAMKFSDFTKPELDKILSNANFTEEEEKIFLMLSKGKTITEVALKTSTCNRTVNRKVAAIKTKISRLEV